MLVPKKIKKRTVVALRRLAYEHRICSGMQHMLNASSEEWFWKDTSKKDQLEKESRSRQYKANVWMKYSLILKAVMDMGNIICSMPGLRRHPCWDVDLGHLGALGNASRHVSQVTPWWRWWNEVYKSSVVGPVGQRVVFIAKVAMTPVGEWAEQGSHTYPKENKKQGQGELN